MASGDSSVITQLLREGGEWNWLAGLSSETFQAVAQCSSNRQVAAGASIYRRGEPTGALYQVLSGRVRIRNFSSGGKELLYSYMEPGDCFGELGLIDGKPRHHEADADQETSLAILRKSDFDRLRNTFPDIDPELLQLLSKRTRRIYDWVEEAFLLDVPRRLARRLCTLGASQHRVEEGGGQVLHCSHEDLAKMVGSSRQSVTSILKRWERDGLVRQEYGRLYLLDQSALQQFASS